MTTKRNISTELKILLENSPLGIVLSGEISGGPRLLYTNLSFQNMLGYSEAELSQKSVIDITHPESLDASIKAIRQAFETHQPATLEKQYIHKDGHTVTAIVRIASVIGEDGYHYQCTNVEDISERKRLDEELKHQASHDSLTNLMNRQEFERHVNRLIEDSRLHYSEHAMLYLDLDQFKVINDTCGYAAGDKLLCQISSTLTNAIRSRDILARLGGDEFGILLELCSMVDAYRLAGQIQKAVQNFKFSWESNTHKVSVSMGVVTINETTPSLSILLRDADSACYIAKDKGRNRIHIYHVDDMELSKRYDEMQWVNRINKALDDNRFCLYAQTISPISKNNHTGKHYELLVRMLDDEKNIISPDAFLPAAERYNVIRKIDQWVIESFFEFMTANQEYLERTRLYSINLSGQSMAEPDFLEYILAKIKSSGIDASKLCFEITETAAITNLNTASKFIQKLRELNCSMALDDFGSGLSSFGYLKNLPVDYLKIDGQFVKDIVDDPIDYAMVKSINDIGHIIGLKVIAEYVENAEIQQKLKMIGVDYVQGFYIDRPVPLELVSQSEKI